MKEKKIPTYDRLIIDSSSCRYRLLNLIEWLLDRFKVKYYWEESIVSTNE